MSYYNSQTLSDIMEQFVRAPIENPDILPSILPIVAGAIVIELYFGKHKEESLGWNTSVGNSIIWVTTGLNLYLTSELTQPELYATAGLIGLGLIVGYMDFFHKWSSTVAFVLSSSGIVYTLSYILVIVVKTDLTLDQHTLKAGAIFFVATNIAFRILQGFESDQDRQQNMMLN
jgi:hypothetical protein